MKEELIFDGTGKIQVTVTAATTDIITGTAHGYKDGDKVQFTTTGTLPAGLSLTTDYYVIKIDANTFKVSANLGGPVVDITDTGSGTHTANLKGRTVFVEGYNHLKLSINTSGSANLTFKPQVSHYNSAPLFTSAASKTNPWDYVGMYDTEDGAFIDGDTGIALAGTDDHRQFKVNIDSARWMSIDITAWSAGLLRASVSLMRV